MYSPRKATIIFVAILLLFLLSFVSAELNKRDPQAPGGGGGGNQPPPAGGGGGGGAAGGGNQPAAGGGGGGGGNQPAAGGGGAAGGGNQPAAGGGGNQPGGGAAAPPAAGGNNPSPAGNPPGPAGAGGGNNPSPAGNPPGPVGNNTSPAGNPPGPVGNNTSGSNPTNGTVPKYVDPSVQPLQVQMIEPKSAKNIIYKIGTNITFKWNYSDNGTFADPPTTIVVQSELVQTDSKSKTYFPIQNLTLVTNTTQVAFWDTAAVQTSLPMGEYKLWISDQDGINAPPKPGGLLTFSGLQFGLYSQQDTGTFCATCTSNAISIPMISLSYIIGVALVTVATFNLISI